MASSAEETREDFEHLASAPPAPSFEEQEESSASTSAGAAAASASDPAEGDESANAAFECNICLDVAHDAVVSHCGHLFCWPCLHTWLETRPNRQICPVCKAAIAKDKVIPLYGRGNTNPKDPRDKPIPPRPRGQRTEPENNGGGIGGGGFFGPFVGGGPGGGGLQMSFGIGAFPFGFFTNFNVGGENANRGGGHVHMGTPQWEEEQIVHKFFLYVAMAFVFWLMIA